MAAASLYSVHGISIYKDRMERMNKRFDHFGINIQWILNPMTKNDERNVLKDVAFGLMRNHIQAIKDFLNGGCEYGIICEDDIYLRKTFDRDILVAIDGFKRLDLNVLLLSYLVNYKVSKIEISPFHKTLETPFLFLSVYDQLWGSSMYLINKRSGKEMIEMFDDYTKVSPPYSSDWKITKVEKNALMHPMLGVEEGESKSGCDAHTIFHRDCNKTNYDPDWYI